jgi:hypothetical protein
MAQKLKGGAGFSFDRSTSGGRIFREGAINKIYPIFLKTK